MKFITFGLVFVLISGIILETSARAASEAIQLRQRRRNRNNAGQRRIIIARQAVPIAQQQQAEVYEEELPTPITETEILDPNQRLVNVNADSQRFIGTGFGNIFGSKATLFSLLASTTTTTTTTTVAPVTTAVGTITGTVTLTPLSDPIAPTQTGNIPTVQQRQHVLMRPVSAGAFGPIAIRRHHGAAAINAHRRRAPLGVIRNDGVFGGVGAGAQVIRIPIPIRMTTG